MNKFTKTALLVAGAALVTQAAQAYTANDLILGLRTDTASDDYVINLGNAASSVGVGGSSVMNLSSMIDITTINSLFGGLNGVQMGVVGGNPAAGSSKELYVTSLRLSLGTPSVAGSTTPATVNASPANSGILDVGGVANNYAPSAGSSATPARTDQYSFSTLVSPGTGFSGQFINDTGVDPLGTASGNVLYEDLYQETFSGATAQGFQYMGYFTLDTSGASAVLSFTPNAVPEPATFSLMGGAALLLLSLRRKFSRQQL